MLLLGEIALSFDARLLINRLLEDMYSLDDVTNILNGLRDVIKSTVRDELEKFSHQSVLYLRMLFLQAEAHSVSLKLDTSKLDDE
jgi:leucine zipper transcription factor-like protein 1